MSNLDIFLRKTEIILRHPTLADVLVNATGIEVSAPPSSNDFLRLKTNFLLNVDLSVWGPLLTGLLVHHLVFRRGEWDSIADQIFWTHAAIFGALYSALLYIGRSPSSAEVAVRLAAQAALIYIGTVFASIVIYRKFFHRLDRFPGPPLAPISNWHTAFLSLKRWRIHEEVQSLHQRYGDYVRVGPSELSVSDPDALAEIYGTQSVCLRGPIASLSPDRYLYAFDRDKAMHHSQRRIWSRAFSAKAVLQYDTVIARHASNLRTFLADRVGRRLNMSEVFRLSSFDLMAEIFYGQRDSNTLRHGKETRAQTAVHHLKLELAIVKYMPWIVSLGKIWPFRAGGYTQVCAQSDSFVDQILKDVRDPNGKTEGPTSLSPREQPIRAFDHFLDALNVRRDPKGADRILRGHSDLFLIAGWDNQANMMATILFHLVQHPCLLALVREELETKHAELNDTPNTASSPATSHDTDDNTPQTRTTTTAAVTINPKVLNSLPHLTSVILEVMRLYPSLAQGVQRMTPSQSLQIGKCYVPGDTIITMPQYTLFRDPRSFVDPDTFRPERWTTSPELVKNKKVFVPFGTGLSPCPGRHLATRMMRYIVADIVLNFDFELAPTTTPDKIMAGKYEAFNMVFGDVDLVFWPKT